MEAIGDAAPGASFPPPPLKMMRAARLRVSTAAAEKAEREAAEEAATARAAADAEAAAPRYVFGGAA